MKHKLLVAIGNEFTQQWIESQGDSKLKGFNRSAEYCLMDQKELIIANSIALFFWVCALILFFLGSYTGGILVILLGFLIKYSATITCKHGTTAQNILKAWKPIRRELLKQGVVSKCLKVFKRDHPTYDFFPQDWIRDLLVKSIDELMSSLSADFIEAQREGFPKKEATLCMKMLDLRQLTRDLGLKMNFDQFFPPQREETVRVIFRRAEAPIKG